MINTNLLKGEMRKQGLTQSDVREHTAIKNNYTLNYKINGKRHFYVEEAQDISNFLKLSKEDFLDIFFPNIVFHDDRENKGE